MNKQIEEMSEFLWDVQSREDEIEIYNTEALAKRLVDANYRKSTDVAREIFEEIEKTAKDAIRFCERYSVVPMLREAKVSCYKDLLGYIAELKKKYESEGAEDE